MVSNATFSLTELCVGEAEALEVVAKAKSGALLKVGEALKGEGKDAASLTVAEQYVSG